jgi:hypothetical protein
VTRLAIVAGVHVLGFAALGVGVDRGRVAHVLVVALTLAHLADA